MALPESGKMGSNVLRLEDVRNKHKSPARTTTDQVHSEKGDELHDLPTGFEKDAHPTGEVEQIEVRSKPDLVDQNVDTEVIKTPAKRSLVSNRRFDKVKVERIKAELANDSYEINFLRVADKFIEHERFG